MLVGSTGGLGVIRAVVLEDAMSVLVLVPPPMMIVLVDTRTVGTKTVTVLPGPVTVLDLSPLVLVTVNKVVVVVEPTEYKIHPAFLQTAPGMQQPSLQAV